MVNERGELIDTRPWEEEADRQFILLSLALCALLRPGFDYAAGKIAQKLNGRAMFEAFKKANRDIVHPSP